MSLQEFYQQDRLGFGEHQPYFNSLLVISSRASLHLLLSRYAVFDYLNIADWLVVVGVVVVVVVVVEVVVVVVVVVVVAVVVVVVAI